MLQYQTVHPATLELLKTLMTKPYLDSFVLVGGTALALQIGHRTSIDLDLFTNELFSAADIYDQLEDELRVAEPFVKDKAPYLWK